MKLHIRITHTHKYAQSTQAAIIKTKTHTLHNLFHYLSLFGGAGLTHNLEFGSCSLHIKRLTEKQIAKIKSSAGVSPGQHASVSNIHRITFTHTHTHINTYNIHHGYANNEASAVL